ncbi:PEP-CTERM protein-sorting domain-containing protein [Verrucomicrobium sp. GAS474]|uniref:PEP-CTERM sorting domain-containing protein n=1 Tax=Verrucomicrobium sp. GAS474 TaxID=1882831 RepID=UPI00087A0523|nr:PEP-CTERM sorting domain-containing protein [Verrucomicrobium sp. GAS474]SDT99029.1 PEP-CTERM protein-sorting domain-containing protein [Verrucomicrobium sp. GAS474]
MNTKRNRFFTSLSKVCGIGLALFAAVFFLAGAQPLSAQNLFSGSSVDLWPTLNGSHAATPTGWSSAAVQAPGLLTAAQNGGSTDYFSALFMSTTGALKGYSGTSYISAPNYTGGTAVQSFQLSFVFAATDPGSGNSYNDRSLSFYVYQNGTNTAVQSFRTVETTGSPGFLDIQSYNGSAWVQLATGIAASTYDTTTNTWTALNAYNFSLTTDFTTKTSTLTWGAVGGTQTSVAATFYPAESTTGYLNGVGFGNNSTAAFAIDNVTVTAVAVPEPATNALLALGGLFFLALVRRNRRLAWETVSYP